MRIEIEGVFYRERRGKLVAIPDEWLNKVPSDKTLRDRASRLTNKKKRDNRCNRSQSKWLNDFKDKKDLPLED